MTARISPTWSHYAKTKYRSTQLRANLIRQQIFFLASLPSIRLQLFHSTFPNILGHYDSQIARVIYLKSGCIIIERSQREVGMVISPISVGGVAENRIMHDNECLSTCVSNDSTKFAQNISEDNSRVHVCVCVCVHVDIVWIWRYGIIVGGRDLKIFPAITFW